jgi:hypothetical protein
MEPTFTSLPSVSAVAQGFRSQIDASVAALPCCLSPATHQRRDCGVQRRRFTASSKPEALLAMLGLGPRGGGSAATTGTTGEAARGAQGPICGRYSSVGPLYLPCFEIAESLHICHDISLLRGWSVAGLPLIGTKRAEHQGIRSWAGPRSMIDYHQYNQFKPHVLVL